MKFVISAVVGLLAAQFSKAETTPTASGQLVKCVTDVLKTNTSSRIITPGNQFYTDARLGEKIQFEQLPTLIAYVERAEEVAPLIRCARAAGIKAVPRNGGHHFEAYSSLNGTLVIDLGHLNDVKVSSDRRTAVVGAGIRLGALYTALNAYNTTFAGGICPTVGLSGLISSGGFNMQMRKLGISANYVMGAKVVTADGRTLTVSATSNSDLFWAIRGGGGGTYGIVVEFTLSLIQMPRAAMLMISWNTTDSQFPVAKKFLEWSPKQTEDLTTQVNIYKNKVSILGWHYGGTKQQLQTIINNSGLLSIGKPTVVISDGCNTNNARIFGYIAFECLPDDKVDSSILNVIPDPFTQYKSYPKFAYNEKPKSDAIPVAYPWERFLRLSKSFFVLKNHLPSDKVIMEVVNRINQLDDESQIWAEWHSWNIACPDNVQTAFAWCRDAYAHLEFQIHGSEDPKKQAVYEKWFKDLESLLRPALGNASYSGYMDADISVNPLSAYYGSNVCKLIQIKKKYDPEGFFTNPLSIPPSPSKGISC